MIKGNNFIEGDIVCLKANIWMKYKVVFCDPASKSVMCCLYPNGELCFRKLLFDEIDLCFRDEIALQRKSETEMA